MENNNNKVRIVVECTIVEDKEADSVKIEGCTEVKGTGKNLLLALDSVYRSLLERHGPMGRGLLMDRFARMINETNEEYANKLEDKKDKRLLEDILKEFAELMKDKEEKE